MTQEEANLIYNRALTIAKLYENRVMNQQDIANTYGMPILLVEKVLWEMNFYYGKYGFPNSHNRQRLINPYVNCFKIQKLLYYNNIPITRIIPFELVSSL